jgi:hypothetical protein
MQTAMQAIKIAETGRFVGKEITTAKGIAAEAADVCFGIKMGLMDQVNGKQTIRFHRLPETQRAMHLQASREYSFPEALEMLAMALKKCSQAMLGPFKMVQAPWESQLLWPFQSSVQRGLT